MRASRLHLQRRLNTYTTGPLQLHMNLPGCRSKRPQLERRCGSGITSCVYDVEFDSPASPPLMLRRYPHFTLEGKYMGLGR